jgi:putative transcriptional regulator
VRRSNEEVRTSKGHIDRERFGAATEEDIQRWKAEDGFGDDSVWGNPQLVVPPPAVRRVREGMGLSQKAFAERFGLSLRTVQDWEQGRRSPDGPARLVLRIIEREPEAAVRALSGTEPQ